MAESSSQRHANHSSERDKFMPDVAGDKDGIARTFDSWVFMLKRCYIHKSIAYERYGAVGISVASEWQVFHNFFKDMGIRPVNTTLDRIDNALGYVRGNCRWADKRSQASNRTNVKQFLVNGKVFFSVSEISAFHGLDESVVIRRLQRGYPIESAVDSQACKKIKLCKKQAEEIKQHLSVGKTQKELATTYGVTRQTINHIANGKTWK